MNAEIPPAERVQEMAVALRRLADDVGLQRALNETSFTFCSFLTEPEDALALLIDSTASFSELVGADGRKGDASTCHPDAEIALSVFLGAASKLAKLVGLDEIDAAALARIAGHWERELKRRMELLEDVKP